MFFEWLLCPGNDQEASRAAPRLAHRRRQLRQRRPPAPGPDRPPAPVGRSMGPGASTSSDLRGFTVARHVRWTKASWRAASRACAFHRVPSPSRDSRSHGPSRAGHRPDTVRIPTGCHRSSPQAGDGRGGRPSQLIGATERRPGLSPRGASERPIDPLRNGLRRKETVVVLR